MGERASSRSRALAWPQGVAQSNRVGDPEVGNALLCRLDTSKRMTSVCVLNSDGGIIDEGEVETAPKALVDFLRGHRRRYAMIGMEAGPLGPWLCDGLQRAGLPAICIDARHAHGALQTQLNKTDRTDARGLAQLIRTGSHRAVHIKTAESSLTRGLLRSRKVLVAKLGDLQRSVAGLLLAFGLKVDRGHMPAFEGRWRP